MHGLPEVLVKSMTSYDAARVALGDAQLHLQRAGRAGRGRAVTAGDDVDVGVEFDALPGAAGAVVVTVMVGVARPSLPEDAQPAAAATQANAAAATASRPTLNCLTPPGDTGVPFMCAAPHAPP